MPLERDLTFEISYEVLDANAPFHNALGKRTTTSEDPNGVPASGDEYTKDLFTEEDILPPITVEHAQADAGVALVQQWFIGAKSDLSLTFAVGEALKATQSFVATKYDEEDAAPAKPDLAIPKNKPPFMFHHKETVKLYEPGTQVLVKDLDTVNSGDLSWNNGNEARHHGTNRDAYAVAETEAEGKYDMKLELDVPDAALWRRAVDDADQVDVEIPFARPVGQVRDMAIIRLKSCELDINFPHKTKGPVTAELVIFPTNTDLEIRKPA